MTNVLLAGFTSHWHRRKSSMRTTGEEPTSATQLSAAPQRPEPLERNTRTILLNSKGAENQQESAEGEVFLVDFPSYRTLQAPQEIASGLPVIPSDWCQ
jgi:hypothetical protein